MSELMHVQMREIELAAPETQCPLDRPHRQPLTPFGNEQHRDGISPRREVILDRHCCFRVEMELPRLSSFADDCAGSSDQLDAAVWKRLRHLLDGVNIELVNFCKTQS